MSRKKPDAAPATAIVGRNPVREALRRGDAQFEKVLLQKGAGGKPIDEIRRAAADAGVPVQYVPPQRLDQAAPGTNHQGVVGLTAPVEYAVLEDMLAGIAPTFDDVRARKPIVLLLDQIEDPYNFGAILRTAVAFGVAGVIVPQHHMAPLNATVIKASAGTALRIPVARVTNLADAIAQLKERGYWVAGAAGESEDSIEDMDWDRPLALVIGNEGRGLRTRTAAACDYRLRIPMRGPAESLNASVAAALFMYAATRDRA